MGSWNHQKKSLTFFVEVKVLKKDQKDTKRMNIEEETFPI